MSRPLARPVSRPPQPSLEAHAWLCESLALALVRRCYERLGLEAEFRALVARLEASR